MAGGKIRVASIENKLENILSAVAGQGGGLASLANGAQSVLSAPIYCGGARAVYLVLSGAEDPSAATTCQVSYFMRAGLPAQVNGANFAATDTNFGSATNSKGVVFRIIAASGGANDNLILPCEFIQVQITNAGAAPITSVRLDAIVVL